MRADKQGSELNIGAIVCLCCLLWLLSCTSEPPATGVPTIPSSLAPNEVGGTTMDVSKLDQRLIEEIRVRRESGLAAGKSEEEIAQELYAVTIELVQSLSIPKGLTRQQTMEEMERAAEESQAGVAEALWGMGVTDFERQILSNSIATLLTIEQIEEIASRNDVKIIRLVRVEKVIP